MVVGVSEIPMFSRFFVHRQNEGKNGTGGEQTARRKPSWKKKMARRRRAISEN